jgi:hypothetical protein
LLVVEAPTSPFAEGLSTDRRALGLGLRKLSLTSAPPPQQSGSMPPA